MSTHNCLVIKLERDKIIKNENSDNLYWLTVPDTGYTCVIRGTAWINDDGTLKHTKAAYVQPQTICPTSNPKFAFLKQKDTDEKVRVKAKKLRGIQSFGLLVPVSDDVPVGTNMWSEWNLEHYEPQPEREGGNNSGNVPRPPRDFSKYDIENIKNYLSAFVENELIVAMEKFEGQNMRVCYQNEQIYVGSRSFWKDDVEGSDFWRSYRSVPDLERLVKENSHICVFGESYGNVPKFMYDCPKGERRFRAFDMFNMETNLWLQYAEFKDMCEKYSIPICPVIYEGPFDFEKLKELAETDSPLKPGQMMEGLVIWPLNCDFHRKLGRRKAKLKSLRYEEKY